MKKTLFTAVGVVLTLMANSTVTFAQDGPPQFRPVELWACQFKDRKDQGDMDDVYERIVDSTGDARYAAFQLNPYFAGNRGRDFDFLYLGAWESGSEMGSDMSNYMTNHPDVGAAWEEVVDCASLMFASSWIQAPATGDDGEFMVTMSDCTVGHGHSNAQAVGALARYNAYRVENGMTVGTITWWPVLGGGEDEFDFKLVNVFDGPQHFGDHFSWYTDNQVYNVQGPMMRGTVDCDTSRAYIGRTIMNNMN